MKKIAIAFSLVLTILFTNLLNAQRCGSMEHLHEQMQQDPGLAARMQEIETQTAQFLSNGTNETGGRAIITIPVVVHVVGNASVQAVSDAQIQSQINRLNLDFRKLNTDVTNVPSVWTSLVADYEIEFCLARRDPSGNNTTGIIRKVTTATSFSTNDNVKRTANGGSDAWPAGSYLNLWVCNLSGGVLGYAQFPGGNASTDGVVITYTGFGTMGTAQAPYNLGRTATHEIGHWLNLYHIWGDDGSSCNGSDNVGDTPNQGSEHYGCPSFPSVSCSNGPNGDMWMNYMDYTDDRCMYMFTNGQKARSLTLFNTGGSRASLLSSLGCQALNSPPNANFSADVTSSCTGVVKFTDASTNGATSWSWDFGDGTSSTLQSPTHIYTTNGSYTVTLTATNQFGSDNQVFTNYINISKPAAPAANDVSRCGSGSFSLSTTSTNPLAWLDSAGNKVSSANPFVTPVLTQTRTYWLQDTVGGVQYHVGKADNSGGGGYLNSNWALIFNVNTACVLQSVYVYAQGAGNRTFEVRTSGGTVLQTATVNVPNGGSRVTLNFNLTPGTGYRLGFNTNSNINLYRNNAGGVYPYSDAGGYVSITGNNANNAASYYYYCYDWILVGAGCVSERRAVTAFISAGLTAVPSVTNATCGSGDGSASVNVSGGNGAYTYIWSNGGTSSSIANLSPGTYNVTVNDANTCSGTATAVVAGAANLTSSKSQTDATCFGGNDGSAFVTVSNGTPNYSYLWSNGNNTSNAANLAAGDYTVTITDGNSCVHVDSFTITQPDEIDIQITHISPNCHGESNGSVTLNTAGGTLPYSINWSPAIPNPSNLSAGTYDVTVTDGNSCSATSSFIMDEPALLTTNTTSTPVSCFNGSNGTANAIPSGGLGSYSYQWCNGDTTHNTSGLSAGICSVTVTDENGCSVSASVTSQQPPQMVVVTSATNSTAQVDSVYGGAGPFTYVWSNTLTGPKIFGLSNGTYFVTVTDANGCTSGGSITVVNTSLNEIAEAGISFDLLPNPAKERTTLLLHQLNRETSFTVKNMLGQLLVSKPVNALQTEIDLSSFAPGVYLIEVRQGEARLVKQVIVGK